MPAPIRPSEFCALVPSPTSSLCDRILKVFIQMPQKLCDFFTWMFNEDGTLTENFKNEAQIIPTATVVFRLSATIPAGWLEANGQEVSRTIYAMLFAEIGTQYGVGDGSTTFNVPDMRDRVQIGRSATKTIGQTGGEALHVLTAAEGGATMEHEHVFGRMVQNDVNDDFVFTSDTTTEPYTGASSLVGQGINGPSAGGANPQGPLSSAAGRYLVTGRNFMGTTIAPTIDGHNTLPPYMAGTWLIKT